MARACIEEIHDVQGIYEVNECITDVALVREVDTQVHEIVTTVA